MKVIYLLDDQWTVRSFWNSVVLHRHSAPTKFSKQPLDTPPVRVGHPSPTAEIAGGPVKTLGPLSPKGLQGDYILTKDTDVSRLRQKQDSQN